jgi:CDP-glucose 4,6-dehydratase
MFGDIYRGKRVLVTGNTGFKGSWLSIWLHELGASVYGISNGVPSNPSLFESLELRDIVTYYEQDVRDLEQLKRSVAEIKPDFVFHLAAQPIVKASYQDPIETFSTNIMGSCNIMEALRQVGEPCQLIMITSDKAYRNVEWTWGYRENDRLGGKDPYSASKGGAELAIRSYFHSFFNSDESPVKLISVRAGNVIGGGDWSANRIVPDCVRAWSENLPVFLRSPHSTRPWQHVLEPLSGYLRAGQALLERPSLNGESYNFGPNSEQNRTVLELIQSLAEYWDFAEGAEVYQLQQQRNFHEDGLLKLNCDKALHQLAWKPTLAFEQTVEFTSRWYNHFYKDDRTSLLQFTRDQIVQYTAIAAERELAWSRSLVLA